MKHLQFNNKTIRYKSEGNGNCIVLLHGFAESLDIWDGFAQELSKKFNVLTIDLPGHGESQCIEDGHSMENMAEVVKTILDQCHVNKAVITGHSMGGYVTLSFAEKYPEMISGLCLFHSTAFADTEEKKLDRTRTIEIVKNNKIGFVTDLIDKLFAKQNQESLAKQIVWAKEIGKKTTAEGIIAAIIGMRDREDRTEVLRNLKSPALFILGKNDIVLPIEKHASLVTMPAHSEALILESSGHMGFIENKKETLYTLSKFAEFCFLN